MPSEPSVTIIITVRDRLDYIGQAIESVLSQTYRDYEIIVVDDGSVMPAESTIMGFDNRIRYIYQENKGLAAARNRGIQTSRGRYIGFLDDDDLYEEKKLETQVAILEKDPEIGFVYSDSWEFSEHDMEKCRINHATGREASIYSFAHRFFLEPNVRIPTVLFRKTSLKEAGLFDEHLLQHEDGDILLKIALSHKTVHSPYPSARIRSHTSNMSKDRATMYKSIIDSSRNILEQNSEFRQSLGPVAEDRLAGLYCQLAGAYLLRSEVGRALQSFKSCWELSRSYETFCGIAKVTFRSLFQKMRHQ